MPGFREIHSLFNSLLQGEGVYPAFRLFEEKDGYVLEAQLPGVAAQDMKITVQGKTLYIEGERTALKAEEGSRYHRQERNFGSFKRAFTLPAEIDASAVVARHEDGMLRMEMPKDKAVLPREIKVN